MTAAGHPLLGRVDEICIVTPDLITTASGLLELGVGPWRMMEINPGNTTEQTYRGRPQPFTIHVAFADVGGTVFELMQPMDENSIFAEFLREKGEGLHHVSFNMGNRPWKQRLELFRARGFEPVQSGVWLGDVRFAFFDTEAATGMSFETYQYPPDHRDPDGEVTWFPHQEWSLS